MRDIAAEAGVSLSAINYYFSSQVNLLLTILRARLTELELARNELLQQAAQREPVDLREIVRAIMMPLATWRSAGSTRHAAVHFLSQAFASAKPELKAQFDDSLKDFRKVIDLLQRALPAMDRAEICWRLHFLTYMAYPNAWDLERLQILSEGQYSADNSVEALERAIDFAVAGFLAAPYRP